MNVIQPVPESLPEFSFTWSPVLGAYRCEDPRGVTLETTLTSCSCSLSTFLGGPCEHSLTLLSLAEDGAVTDGPLAIASEVGRQRAAQEALMNEVINRAWDYALEVPEPEAPQPCLCCGRTILLPEPLVRGWGVICEGCMAQGT